MMPVAMRIRLTRLSRSKTARFVITNRVMRLNTEQYLQPAGKPCPTPGTNRAPSYKHPERPCPLLDRAESGGIERVVRWLRPPCRGAPDPARGSGHSSRAKFGATHRSERGELIGGNSVEQSARVGRAPPNSLQFTSAGEAARAALARKAGTPIRRTSRRSRAFRRHAGWWVP